MLLSSDPSPDSEDDLETTLSAGAPSPSALLRENAGRILGQMLAEEPDGLEKEGDSIGPYRLRELLGEGGFGSVWRAEQTEIVRREVAVKVIKPGMDTVQVLSRFNQERQALAALDHPNIATMLNADVTPDGRPYFAMELVSGGPVTAWCEQHHSPLQERLRLFIQICQAVQHAHGKGILHRDIKPSNILVTEIDGRPVPKIIDFGIAKAVNATSLNDLTMLTQVDQVLGTPVYMSPEQIEGGRQLDARTDVYALGVLLYELLTGALPFDPIPFKGGDIASMKRLIAEVVPERPSTRIRRRSTRQTRDKTRGQALPATLSSDLDWITLKALEKSRDRRYPSALDLAADIQRHIDHQRVLARPPGHLNGFIRWIKRHRAGCAAAAVGSVLSVSIFGLLLRWKDRERYQPAPIVLTAEGSYSNSLGMKFVPIPGTDVLFCVHETRRQDYAAYAGALPGVNSLWTNIKRPTMQGEWVPCGDQDDHPAVAVSWEEAQAYCSWLSEQEGWTYRLPTDAEWSLAVGLSETRTADTTPAMLSGKNTDIFPWGTGFPPKASDPSGNYADAAWLEKFANEASIKGYADGFPTTSPVMRFKPNQFGLCDLGGNAGEWVNDWFDETKKKKVIRGACFLDSTSDRLLASTRNAGPSHEHYSGTGFRCVLERKPPATRPQYVPPPPPLPNTYRPPKALPLARFPDPLPPDEVARRSLTNSIGMKFIPVPGSRVLFCVHETRRRDYETFAKSVPGPGPGAAWRTANFQNVPTGMGDDHPVSSVSWEEARLFCVWLSGKEGKTYRLPTDHEWSIAVGLGEVERDDPNLTPQMKGDVGRVEFPYGGRFPPQNPMRAGNYGDLSVQRQWPERPCIKGYDDGYPTSAPVMSYTPNPFGLYDMGGNVWEWVEDWYNKLQDMHVIRGGSWIDDYESALWSARRFSVQGGVNQYNHGFRVVLEPAPELKAK